MEAFFSAEEIELNERKKAKLIELLQRGEAILMAGAGCSASLYPAWRDLLQLFYEEACHKKPDFPLFNEEKDNFLTYADLLKNCLGSERFYNIIYRCFKPKGRDEKQYEKFHQVLCRFLNDGKLQGITTTNYDLVLEEALQSVTHRNETPVRIDNTIAPAKIFEFLFSLNDGATTKRILHLHGVYDERDSIILAGSDYEEKYGFKLQKSVTTLYQQVQNGVTEREFEALLHEFGMAWTKHRKIVWSLLATRRLIFMGFSFSDPYFNQMLASVSDDLHTYGFANHFLILRITSDMDKGEVLRKAASLKGDYGIETVFFEDDDKREGLANFVFELESRLYEQGAEASAEFPPEPPSEDVTDASLNETLIQLSRQR